MVLPQAGRTARGHPTDRGTLTRATRWIGRVCAIRALRGLSFAALAALSALLWLLAWAAAMPLLGGWTPTVVMSGSMAPAINTGDAVITAPYQAGNVDVGSVIVFDEPTSGRTLVHRVVGLTPDRHYITRGDANTVNDPTSINPHLVHGTGRIVVPYVGLPVVWATTGDWGRLAGSVGMTAVMGRSALGLVRRRPADGLRPSAPVHGRHPGPDPHAERMNGHHRPPVPVDLNRSRLVNDPSRIPGTAAIAATVLAGLLTATALVADTAGAAFTGTTSSSNNGYGTGTLAAPTSLTADRSIGGQTTLNWTATPSTWATGYDIYRSSTSGCCYSLLTTLTGRTTTSYTDISGWNTPAFVSSATASNPNDVEAITINRPAATASGHLLIAHVSTDETSSFITPAGWTQLTSVSTGTGGGVTTAVFYRVAGASEPTSYTFAWSGALDAVGAILVYSGVDANNPIQTWATATGTPSTPIAPSVTTTSPDTMVIRFMTADENSLPSPTSNVYPTGTSGRYAVQSNAATGVATAAADLLQAAAGSTGTAAFNLATTEERWITVTIGLQRSARSYHYLARASYLDWRSPYSNEA